MSTEYVQLGSLFAILPGDYHAVKELQPGPVPLVSCGDTNNGVIGKFNIPSENIHQRRLTVAYNGSWPLLTKYHPYCFGAKDDVGVLIPMQEMAEASLLYFAAIISRERWRYSYGRKCYSEKVPSVRIPIPVRRGKLDEELIAEQVGSVIGGLRNKGKRLRWEMVGKLLPMLGG